MSLNMIKDKDYLCQPKESNEWTKENILVWTPSHHLLSHYALSGQCKYINKITAKTHSYYLHHDGYLILVEMLKITKSQKTPL